MYAAMSTPAHNPGWTDDDEITAVASQRGLHARLLQKEQEIVRLRQLLQEHGLMHPNVETRSR
jgi:hypothetical protein